MRILPTLFLIIALPAAVLGNTPNFRAWIDSPEAYFATNEDRDEWQRVLSRDQADQFIERYWKKRGEQFKKDVYSRIDHADSLFKIPGVPGSHTARGRVWMILGSPTRESLARAATVEAGIPGQFQNNSVERGAIMSTRWLYQKDKLPLAAGVPELVVNFQTNTARGQEVIENVGVVEPYLKRVVALYVSRGSIGNVIVSAAAPTATSADDPLWRAAENLEGVYFEGDAYLAANEKPFFAASFYIPRSTTAFTNTTSVLMVALVKNERGEQVATLREQLPLLPYGSTGDRYVDRSVQLAPGKYTGAFALFSPEGSTLLAHRKVSFNVPSPADAGVSVLMPTAKVDVLEGQQLPFDPFTFVATKYAVKGDHRFTPKDRVGFFTVVSNPAGDPNPSLLMTIELARDGKVVTRTSPSAASLTQTGPHTWLVGPLFEPGTFKPGRYDIALILRDVKAAKGSDAFVNGFIARTHFRVE